MIYDHLKNLAEKMGVLGLLERTGQRGRIGEIAGLLTSSAKRSYWSILREDYLNCRAQIRKIAKGAPQGDLNKPVWLICAMPTVWGLKLEGFLSLALRLGNFNPVAVYLNDDVWNRRYHTLFGINSSLNFRRFQMMTSAQPAPEIIEFISNRPNVSDLMDLEYHRVNIGRIALSNTLYRNKFSKFDITQPETLADLQEELLSARRAFKGAAEYIGG